MSVGSLLVFFLLFAPTQDSGVSTARPSPADAGAANDDRELIENLELLEHLDESIDLDLLQELAVER